MITITTFGERLKQSRLDAKLTQDALAQKCNMKKQSISRYENSAREPNIRIAKTLADALGVSLEYLIDNKIPDNLLQFFADENPAKPANRQENTTQAPALAVSRTIDPIYDALNKAGQKELCRYGRYLTTLDEYRQEESTPQIEYIRHYLTAAAAGYAAPIEGEDYELIPRGPSVPASADFCIDISGDSMEPYIHDGETVYVKREAELKEFEPGIFFVDGDVFCKQWCPGYAGETYLLSANPKRQDANIIISRDSGRHCAYFGKVLLKKKLPRPEYF